MDPRTRGAFAATVLSIALLWPTAARAQSNPLLSTDYTNIMQWLTKQTANGLGFNAGSTFDPPNEIPPGMIQPDFSLGIGFVPFNMGAFPALQNQSLSNMGVQRDFPSSILFPNLTAHVRMGLPDRWDVSVRFADMTIPKGYKLTPSTKGDGQSNTFGFSIRKHFMGGEEDPLISVSLNVNHVFGHFNLYNSFNNVQPDSGAPLYFDINNVGRLDWSVTSFGVNLVGSQPFGEWTPFAGLGLNTVSGSVSGKLTSNSPSVLFIPVEGDASSKPEPINGRFIFGTQWDRPNYGLFVNSEVKTIGSEAFKTFIVSFGVARPFSFGVGSFEDDSPRRRTAWPDQSDSDRPSYHRRSYDDESSGSAEPLRDAPASTPSRGGAGSSQPLELIFIQ